jgi:hypothetical protein
MRNDLQYMHKYEAKWTKENIKNDYLKLLKQIVILIFMIIGVFAVITYIKVPVISFSIGLIAGELIAFNCISIYDTIKGLKYDKDSYKYYIKDLNK